MEKVCPDLGDFDHKARSCTHLALRSNRSTVGADELFRDGQAQPAVSPLAAGSIPAPEAIEDEGQIFCGNA